MMEKSTPVINHAGNLDLISLNKTAFLCSRKVHASIVLLCYDWAIEQRKKGICVISGFHSQIEKDVFHYLAKGKQPVILALHRGLKDVWEQELQQMLEEGRLLIITPFEKEVKRGSKETAMIRNKMMMELADNIKIGYASPDGNLEMAIKSEQNFQNKIV
jgi:predicted Rossmann fold nucleotide-binding protein DprA/Smf involved in DNA uptake